MPDAVHHRFDRVLQAHVAPYGLDLSTGLLGQFLGRLLQHVLAAPTDHNVRTELEEAVAHRAAESRAATSHQNALALQEVELKHRILQFLAMAARRLPRSRERDVCRGAPNEVSSSSSRPPRCRDHRVPSNRMV